MTAFVPLCEAGRSCGAKAVTLGRLSRAGFAVPDGFALPVGAGVGWERELPGVLGALGGSRFAVRSSASAEDGDEASFAGQFRTALDVPSDDVEGQVRRTAAAVDRARTYAAAVDRSVARGVAVVVQRMLIPDAAGVAFTRDPVSGRRAVVIEAVRGLGDRLVSGQVSPERWRIAPGDVPRPAAKPEILGAEQAVAVSRVAARAEELLGGGQDVEWALVGNQVWALQARPITSTPSSDRGPAGTPVTNAVTIASGTPASPGRARGVVRIVDGLDDFGRFTPGEVLVCRATSPAWTPLLARAAAVVTTRGGVLAHAAIVARELRIPAVTDVTSAMDLPDDMLVDVDGSTGTITAQKAR
ncbi:PEP/pyruvate-binding domain-containing protein [Nocardia carnea]|uniref:PEP/pyruvate-binding domain-containing protein n=1 Tax=Nocardia carnea TaxID=37328 RepID=UPI00245408D5|nr:PEP/pyruvate-binding domain-containing protein [Nocardia carnea]